MQLIKCKLRTQRSFYNHLKSLLLLNKKWSNVEHILNKSKLSDDVRHALKVKMLLEEREVCQEGATL